MNCREDLKNAHARNIPSKRAVGFFQEHIGKANGFWWPVVSNKMLQCLGCPKKIIGNIKGGLRPTTSGPRFRHLRLCNRLFHFLCFFLVTAGHKMPFFPWFQNWGKKTTHTHKPKELVFGLRFVACTFHPCLSEGSDIEAQRSIDVWAQGEIDAVTVKIDKKNDLDFFLKEMNRKRSALRGSKTTGHQNLFAFPICS